ncbi:hypothetical protein [Hymenobacter armeniacus]|uniref:Uncharacterized protein n=1 Tax=Hymenobacter armeniacus TaxID=2771358 RepID=A0ABR8JSS7_9BACT|nr:hypothetical protein [Hymenobacter armeniacus]MBD2721607.1 hypothetical protein [Hymenobacter armeniacus]
MAELRKKASTVAKRTTTAISPRTAPKATRKDTPAFSHTVFASEAEYNQSVASVVARIQNGQAPMRQPDE